MKKYIIKASIIAMLFCGFSTLTNAVSLDNISYEENYEVYSIGASPASSASGISFSGLGEEFGLSATVLEDSEGDKALCMKYTYNEEVENPIGTFVIGRRFAANDTTMSVKIMVEDTSSTVNIGFRETSSARIWPVVISGGVFKDSSGSVITDCVAGTWYKMDINYNRAVDTLTIYIDGEKMRQITGVSASLNLGAETTTMRIQYLPSGKTETAFWFDDYIVTEANGFIEEPVCYDEDGSELTELKSGVLSFVSTAENNSLNPLELLMLVRASKDDKVEYISWSETVIESGKGGKLGAQVVIPEDYEGYDLECMIIESFENAKPIVKSLKLK